MPDIYSLYYASQIADAAWDQELERVFGTSAGDARYDQRGVSSPKLRELHDAWHKAEDALHSATLAALAHPDPPAPEALKTVVIEAMADAYSTTVENIITDLKEMSEASNALDRFCLLMQKAGY